MRIGSRIGAKVKNEFNKVRSGKLGFPCVFRQVNFIFLGWLELVQYSWPFRSMVAIQGEG